MYADDDERGRLLVEVVAWLIGAVVVAMLLRIAWGA